MVTSRSFCYIGFDAAVADRDNAMSSGSNIRFMRNHNDRVALFIKPFKELHDLLAGLCVESAGRFIGKKN